MFEILVYEFIRLQVYENLGKFYEQNQAAAVGDVLSQIESVVKGEHLPGRLAQWVTCLTADPGITSLISGRSHTFVEIDHEIISTAILLPSTDSRRVVVSYK